MLTEDRDADATDTLGRQRARRDLRSVASLATVTLLAVLAWVLLIASTPHGIHLSNDTFSYLGAASNLAAGRGWTYPFGDVGAPVTLFPPLYPLVLAVPNRLGADVLSWTRWQNAVLLGVFVAAVGTAVRWATDRSVAPTAAAMLLATFGVPTLLVYSFAWSETVYLPLQVLSLFFLARHLASGGRRDLLVASVLASLVLVTRYAGVSLILAECLLLVAWPHRRVAVRAGTAAVFGVIVAIPSGAWAIRNMRRSDTLTGNNELIHAMTRERLLESWTTARGWLLHDAVRVGWVGAIAVSIVVALMLSVVGARVASRRSRAPFPPLAVVCLVFVPIHWLFLVAANALSTRAPPFNDRILGLVYPPLVIAIVVLVDHARGSAGWPPARAAWSVALAVTTVTVLIGAPAVITARLTTARFSADAYRAAAATLRPYAVDEPNVLSDQSNVAWFLLERPVAGLPRPCLGGVHRSDPRYETELAETAATLDGRPTLVVLFAHARHCPPFSPKLVASIFGLGTEAKLFALDQRLILLRRTNAP